MMHSKRAILTYVAVISFSGCSQTDTLDSTSQVPDSDAHDSISLDDGYMTDGGMLSDVVVASDGGGRVMDDDIGTEQDPDTTGSEGHSDSLSVGDTSASPGDEAECADDETFFIETLYPEVLELQCSGCHNPFGLAAQTAFVLEPDTTENAMALNYLMMQDLVNVAVQGVPVLLLRPSGQHPEGHTGGKLTPLGSTAYKHLLEWTTRVLGIDDPCTESDDQCSSVHPGPPSLRRLTRSEYDRTIESLFGFTSTWGAEFTAEATEHGFDNQSDILTVTPLLASQLQSAAESIAAKAIVEAWDTLLPCAPSAATCSAEFISYFGSRVYRRPITDQESTRYLELFTLAADVDGFSAGVELVITAMLQSPHFLYRSELGNVQDDGIYLLSAWEVASELSYLLWGTMPDQELFDRAADGSILTVEERLLQVERLLLDAKAEWSVRRFATQWLDIGQVTQLPKDAATYPELNSGVRAAMVEEALAYVSAVFLGGEPFSALFEATDRKMSPELAMFYGLDGASGEAGVNVAGTPYDAGILGLGAVLMAHAFPTGSSPVHRGALVREQLLCQELTPPPPGLVAQVPPVEPGTTTRQRFEVHMSVQPCLDCHRLTDPIGFAFEHFDGVGRYRETEGGLPIDDSAEIFATDTINGPYDGAKPLTTALGGSDEVRSCFVEQWFRYGYGRSPGANLLCLQDALETEFTSGGTTFASLIQALVLSPHFTMRSDAPTAAPLPEVPDTPESVDGGSGLDSGEADDETDGTPGGVPLGDPDFLVNVALDSQWSGGYCSTATVENIGDGPGTWSTELEVNGVLTQVWNAEFTVVETDVDANSSTVNFSGVVWNQSLAPNQTTGFGFCADIDASAAPPNGDIAPNASIQVEWTVEITSEWDSGFCNKVTVTSLDESAGTWSITLVLPGPISNIWDAKATQVPGESGAGVTYDFVGLGYNAVLPAMSTVSFGYCGMK
ncbi:MAG: DUF1592 domain-containing protein [Myxococcota bacterium]|nr:DUF1592 domain-containing protein [Myxococcota bacterium]